MLITANRTLKSALEDKARRFPDETFLIFEDATGAIARWTWREFDADVNRAARLLQKRGLGPGRLRTNGQPTAWYQSSTTV